ncbi:hypothetical protein Sfulv_40330 [Streptomyces fulvorobeus]|uniref:Uncharacterized protein n=1 Tax=Streptomyces fulvorobeus TaxID=284028 RepID=A0A7J0C9U7_9ACTN|nr:hypothetical protein Sfulv_40330 [Streptomyces fulvorobeus]
MSSPIRTSTPPIFRMDGRRWNGDSQRDDRKRIRRWRDGRLSVAPPKGVNHRDFSAPAAFCRGKEPPGYEGSGQGLPLRVP